jgi:multidrug resistance efflux pump
VPALKTTLVRIHVEHAEIAMETSRRNLDRLIDKVKEGKRSLAAARAMLSAARDFEASCKESLASSEKEIYEYRSSLIDAQEAYDVARDDLSDMEARDQCDEDSDDSQDDSDD